MATITCIRKGFKYKLTIPTADADNDIVKCRWSNATKGECGGVCQTVPPATLDSDKCEISFDGDNATIWFH